MGYPPQHPGIAPINQHNRNPLKVPSCPAFSASRGSVVNVVIELTVANVLATISPSSIQTTAQALKNTGFLALFLPYPSLFSLKIVLVKECSQAWQDLDIRIRKSDIGSYQRVN
jgi:hypothetical protein